jgi:ABC-2 type transport system permease protein
MISQIVGLGMSFLCGAFIPQTMLGSGVLAIGKLFPVYWYVRATDLLSGAQTGTMTDVWICFGVLAGYILLFLLLTILKTAWHPRTQKNTKTAAVG